MTATAGGDGAVHPRCVVCPNDHFPAIAYPAISTHSSVGSQDRCLGDKGHERRRCPGAALIVTADQNRSAVATARGIDLGLLEQADVSAQYFDETAISLGHMLGNINPATNNRNAIDTRVNRNRTSTGLNRSRELVCCGRDRNTSARVLNAAQFAKREVIGGMELDGRMVRTNRPINANIHRTGKEITLPQVHIARQSE